jgi:hypothetical protein
MTSITENNESFTVGTYNGVSTLTRDKDGYVNADKLCHDVNKDFKDFRTSRRWKEMVKYWKTHERQGEQPATYKLKKGYSQCQGIYIHKDLVFVVAMWADVKFALSVCEIMDTINGSVHEEN